MAQSGRIFRWLACLLLGAAAGCAEPNRWEKPGVDETQWDRDRAACRKAAERRVEGQLEREMSRFEDRSSGVGGRGVVRRDFTRTDARRRIAALYDSCLEARGYRRVEGRRD